MDALLAAIPSPTWSEWMALDRIESPGHFQEATTQLLYACLCAWVGKEAPPYAKFFPERRPRTAHDVEAEILAAFGIRAGETPPQ